jgi:phage terminase large subunit-like protein
MLNFSTAGSLGDRSPDRVDALVWALTDLLVEPEPGAAMIEYYRLRAREAAVKKAALAAEAGQRHPAM